MPTICVLSYFLNDLVAAILRKLPRTMSLGPHVFIVAVIALSLCRYEAEGSPERTKDYLVKTVVPTYCKAIKLYTRLAEVVHQQLSEQHEEFNDLEMKTRKKIEFLILNISGIAIDIQFQVKQLKHLAQNDSAMAEQKRSKTADLVLELNRLQDDAKKCKETAEKEIQEAHQKRREAELALNDAQEAVEMAKRKKEAAGCRRKRLAVEDQENETGHRRTKRWFWSKVTNFFKKVGCKVKNAFTGRLKKAKIKLKQAKDKHHQRLEAAHKAEETAKKKMDAYEEAKKKVAEGKKRLHKQELEEKRINKELNSSNILVSKMNNLERFMERVHKHLTEHLKVVDKSLPEIFQSLSDINKVLMEFEPPKVHGRKGKSLVDAMAIQDLEKLQKFSDEAEKRRSATFGDIGESMGGSESNDEDKLSDDSSPENDDNKDLEEFVEKKEKEEASTENPKEERR